MAKYDKIDLKLSVDGDLVIEKGDLAVARKQEYIQQSMRNRIKTNNPEWPDYLTTTIGASMERMRGKPNTVDTALAGVDYITDALTRDGLIDIDDLFIQPVPMDRRTIVFFVFINSPFDTDPIGFEVTFSLDSGVSIKGVS